MVHRTIDVAKREDEGDEMIDKDLKHLALIKSCDLLEDVEDGLCAAFEESSRDIAWLEARQKNLDWDEQTDVREELFNWLMTATQKQFGQFKSFKYKWMSPWDKHGNYISAAENERAIALALMLTLFENGEIE
jgi:hypothetical protein